MFDVTTDDVAVELSQDENAVNYITGTPKSAVLTARGDKVKFTFDFGDGGTATDPATIELQPHVYATPGRYVVSATTQNFRRVGVLKLRK